MTTAEIHDKFEQLQDEFDAYEFIRDYVTMEGNDSDSQKEFLENTGLTLEFVEVEYVYGNEQFWRFKLDDKFYEFTAKYDSWNGTDYDVSSFYQVKPKKKMITVYDKVKE